MTQASTTDIFDPDSFLERSRKDASKHLMSFAPLGSSPLSDDLPYLLRTTNALISMNREIWERCVDCQDADSGGLLCFSRVSVHKVQIQTIEKDTAISVTVHPQIVCKNFQKPPPIPSILLEMVSAHFLQVSKTGKSLQFKGFPDYERYLVDAGRLHEKILVPFLLQLKDHLESIQVFLGDIDTFLSESFLHAPFLEDLFGTKITVLIELNSRCLGGKTGTSKYSECSACRMSYQATQYRTQNGVLNEVCSCANNPFNFTPSTVKIFATQPQRIFYEASFLGKLDALVFLDSEKDQRRLLLLKEYIDCK